MISPHGMNAPLRLMAAYQQAFPDQWPEMVVQAPGREMWVAAHGFGSTEFTLVAPDIEGRAIFNLRTLRSKRTLADRPLPRWARFPGGIALALSASGAEMGGVSAVILGDEPAGPRYQHALGMAFAALWCEHLALPYTTASLVELVDRVMWEYVEA